MDPKNFIVLCCFCFQFAFKCVGILEDFLTTLVVKIYMSFVSMSQCIIDKLHSLYKLACQPKKRGVWSNISQENTSHPGVAYNVVETV